MINISVSHSQLASIYWKLFCELQNHSIHSTSTHFRWLCLNDGKNHFELLFRHLFSNRWKIRWNGEFDSPHVCKSLRLTNVSPCNWQLDILRDGQISRKKRRSNVVNHFDCADSLAWSTIIVNNVAHNCGFRLNSMGVRNVHLVSLMTMTVIMQSSENCVQSFHEYKAYPSSHLSTWTTKDEIKLITWRPFFTKSFVVLESEKNTRHHLSCVSFLCVCAFGHIKWTESTYAHVYLIIFLCCVIGSII